MQLRDSGLTQASLYDNAGSRRFLIDLRNVIVLHNFPIKANTAAVSPRHGCSALSFSRQATIRSETFLRCCTLICFLNLTEPITARTWCIYFWPASNNVPISFFFSHPPDIKAIMHRDPECGALQCLCEWWVDPHAAVSPRRFRPSFYCLLTELMTSFQEDRGRWNPALELPRLWLVGPQPFWLVAL